jgi:hypothetical protein
MGIEADIPLMYQPVDVLFRDLHGVLHGNGLDVFVRPESVVL